LPGEVFAEALECETAGDRSGNGRWKDPWHVGL
jgi:hypothetical protein